MLKINEHNTKLKGMLTMHISKALHLYIDDKIAL